MAQKHGVALSKTFAFQNALVYLSDLWSDHAHINVKNKVIHIYYKIYFTIIKYVLHISHTCSYLYWYYHDFVLQYWYFGKQVLNTFQLTLFCLQLLSRCQNVSDPNLPIEPRLSNQITTGCCCVECIMRLAECLCAFTSTALLSWLCTNQSSKSLLHRLAICPPYYWVSNVALQPRKKKNQSIMCFHGKRFYVQSIVIYWCSCVPSVLFRYEQICTAKWLNKHTNEILIKLSTTTKCQHNL